MNQLKMRCKNWQNLIDNNFDLHLYQKNKLNWILIIKKNYNVYQSQPQMAKTQPVTHPMTHLFYFQTDGWMRDWCTSS